jgi:flagella basal body P-ring formation protein FlgA
LQTACRLPILAASVGLALCCGTAAAEDRARADAASDLMEAARAWAAGLAPAGPQGAEFLPPDARVQTSACASGWRFDLPFADPRAVRARCDRPRAQVFLRSVQALRLADARGVTPPPPPAPTPLHRPVTVPATGPTALGGSAASAAAMPAAPTAEAASPVLVVRTDLRRGDLLDPSAVEATRPEEPPRRGLGPPLTDPTALEHMELVRDKQAGQVLYAHDIQPALLVRRGQLIAVSMQGVPGLRITARLEALQDGRHGQSVRLRNTESGRIVSAVVSGPGEARLP